MPARRDRILGRDPRLQPAPALTLAVTSVAAMLIGAGCDRAPATPAPRTDARSVDARTAEFRPGDLPVSPSWFIDVTAQSGVDFAVNPGARGDLHMPEVMAGGVAAFDSDGDGLMDLYFVDGNDALPAGVLAGPRTNRLFRQQPSGTFVDATAGSGLGCNGYGMGVALGDFDNDGHLDVFVSNFGPDRLFRNRGDGTFEDVSERMKMPQGGWSTSAAFLDFTRSGWLDLYICRYVELVAGKKCTRTRGAPDYCGPKEHPPASDILLRNEEGRTFTDISEIAGIATVRAAGLGVVCADFDDDGWIDIYVANDAYPNNLWRNRGDGTARDIAMRGGSALNVFGHAEAGMGVVAEDLDHSGTIDLFITHLMNETNTLYLNDGRANFTDATSAVGLGASSMAWTGFGVAALDATLDGRLDLFIANGRVYRDSPVPGTTMPEPWLRYAEPNLYYRGLADGRFELLRDEVRELTLPVEVSRGAVAADLDGDGDLDLVVTSLEAPARLFRNDAPRSGRWLAVRAVDPALRRDAIGASILVHAGARRWRRTLSSACSYLSAQPPVAHFGLGSVEQVDRIEVWWPDGRREDFGPFLPDRSVVLERGSGHPQVATGATR
ncbi:MAG: CRTAC1 family protein [Phycisphaeraceae bacterium]|nr:CRTAC1 family protein [Phycisphaeraceae bacterium]